MYRRARVSRVMHVPAPGLEQGPRWAARQAVLLPGQASYLVQVERSTRRVVSARAPESAAWTWRGDIAESCLSPPWLRGLNRRIGGTRLHSSHLALTLGLRKV